MDWLTITPEQLFADRALQRAFIRAYKQAFGKTLCNTCKGTLHRMLLEFQHHLKRRALMPKWKLKDQFKQRVVAVHGGDPISVHNITDEAVEHMLQVNPRSMAYFEYTPEYLAQLKEEAAATDEPESNDT